ncbi:hypothetical protein Leryth_001845 [Lithospermum erythrorhizon]|nr:hypothetical protein Leryth_001845 [Lithospermum erythrorhizon]
MIVPTLDKYMDNAYISFGLRPIVLPALYLAGPKLPQEIVKHSEVQELFKLMSTCGHLLNDIQSYERESEQGKLNSVSQHMVHAIGGQTKDKVVGELWHEIKTKRRELLRLVLQRKDNSVVPKVCKDLFWSMTQGLHFFYWKGDVYTSKRWTKL